MNLTQIRKMLKGSIIDMEPSEGIDGASYNSVYLGSFMSLDPCGRYHCVISPNGLQKRCENFWRTMDKIAEELGGWIEQGEGDPTDIFFCIGIKEDK